MRSVKLSQLTGGETLVADAGFTCLNNNEEVRVEKDTTGALFIRCHGGHHFLDGQLDFDDGDTLVGLKLKETIQ